jgi:hypothetical protein
MANQLYAQYKGLTRAEQLAQMPASYREQFVSVAESIGLSYDYYNVGGEALDIVGSIIGRDRSTLASIKFDVYECNSDGEFECGDESAQCSYLSLTEDSELSDEYFRIVIAAQIAKNNSDATIDDIISIMNITIPSIEVYKLNDGEDMSFSIEFSGEISDIERYFLISGDIVPTPQGVQFKGFLETEGMALCSEDGEFECGDETAQCVGFLEI